MRSVFVCSTLLVSVIAPDSRAAAQPSQNPELKRLHYEVGLRYTDPVGITHLHCDADDYSVTIGWPDGAEIATKLVTPRADGTIPPGSYGFTSTHVFKTEGVTAKVIVSNYSGHCRQGTSRFTLVADPVSVRVWPRHTVKHLEANVSLPLHPGNTANLRVTLDKPAPPSGTRVFIKVDNPSLVTDLPEFVDVTEKAVEREVVFRIVPRVPKPATLTVTATAGGAGVNRKIDITP